jgi:phage FluMu protein Com
MMVHTIISMRNNLRLGKCEKLYQRAHLQRCLSNIFCLLCGDIPEIVVHPSKEEAPHKITKEKNTDQPPSPSRSRSGHVDKFSNDVL